MLLVLFITKFTSGQISHIQNFNTTTDTSSSYLYQKGVNFHPSIKPYIAEEFNNAINIKNHKIPGFIILSDSQRFILSTIPHIGIYPGYGFTEKKSLLESGVGVSVVANIKNRASFEGTYIYTYTSFPAYTDSIVGRNHVAPVLGYAKLHNSYYSFSNLSFYANYKVSKHIIFEGGYGKNMFGDGYRSLFLSEIANNYPYFKIITTFWKIKYINLYTQFNDISDGYSGWGNFKKKYGSFQYLSWNISKRLNLNLFEAVIWRAKTPNNKRGFDINYLNPVIFLRPVEFSVGSPDNALVGIGFHYKTFKSSVIYGQVLFDEFLLTEIRSDLKHIFFPHDSTIMHGSWFNKYAFQLGFKSFDIARIRNLQFQSEFNYVRPYTYSHRDVMQNFGHFNMPLAHPFGANFLESVSFLKYNKNRFSISVKVMYALTGLDTGNTHYGQNIYKSTFDTYIPDVKNVVVNQYGNKVSQGVRTNIKFYNINFYYLIIPTYKFYFKTELSLRNLNSVTSKQKALFMLAGFNLGLDISEKDY